MYTFIYLFPIWNRMKGSYKQVHIHKPPDYVIVLIHGYEGR